MAIYLISGKFSGLADEVWRDSQARTDKILDLIKGQGGEFIAGYQSSDYQLIFIVDLPFQFPSRGDRVAGALSRSLGTPFTSVGITEIWGTWRPDQAEVERRHADFLAQEAAKQEEEIQRAFEQARRRQFRQLPATANKSDQGPIRLLVVDDIADTRATIRKVLASEVDIEIVGEASDGQEAIKQIDALMPDVMTTCIHMPTMDGFTATEAICQKHPWAKVIILSVQDSMNHKRRAIRAGACDYLIKPPMGDELVSAIRLAANRLSVPARRPLG